MQPYQQRVVDEKSALDEKIEKLSAFMKSDQFVKVDDAERYRMRQQLQAMMDYSKVLGARIDAF